MEVLMAIDGSIPVPTEITFERRAADKVAAVFYTRDPTLEFLLRFNSQEHFWAESVDADDPDAWQKVQDPDTNITGIHKWVGPYPQASEATVVRAEAILDFQGMEPDAMWDPIHFFITARNQAGDFSHIYPPEPGYALGEGTRGAGPGLLITFEDWVEPLPDPEPEPEPEPVVVPTQPFTVVPPRDGDTALAFRWTWEEGVDLVSFYVNGNRYDIPRVNGTETEAKFIGLQRTLVAGEVLEVFSVGRSGLHRSAEHPINHIFITVLESSVDEPEPPEPPPPPPPDTGVSFPAVGQARFPENLNEFYLDMPDGTTRKMGRLWKWLDFGWFGTWGIYVGRNE